MYLAVASLSLPCLVLNFCFRQEGWRLEHKEPKDQSSPIEFKGIVFNEMKGVFVCNYIFKLTIMRKGVYSSSYSQSSPDNIFAQAMQNCLFPSNTYSHVSGGLPINILDLEVNTCVPTMS